MFPRIFRTSDGGQTVPPALTIAASAVELRFALPVEGGQAALRWSQDAASDYNGPSFLGQPTIHRDEEVYLCADIGSRLWDF